MGANNLVEIGESIVNLAHVQRVWWAHGDVYVLFEDSREVAVVAQCKVDEWAEIKKDLLIRERTK